MLKYEEFRSLYEKALKNPYQKTDLISALKSLNSSIDSIEKRIGRSLGREDIIDGLLITLVFFDGEVNIDLFNEYQDLCNSLEIFGERLDTLMFNLDNDGITVLKDNVISIMNAIIEEINANDVYSIMESFVSYSIKDHLDENRLYYLMNLCNVPIE